jgi:hypothetical protein
MKKPLALHRETLRDPKSPTLLVVARGVSGKEISRTVSTILTTFA